MKVDYNGGWTAFGMRQASPGVVWEGGTGYFLAFKENEFEYQRFRAGSGGFLQDNIANTYLTGGDWHDVEIASASAEGGVWNYLAVDGETVLNTIDKSGYLEDAALFQIYCFGDMNIQIKAAEEIPSSFDKSIIGSGSEAGISAVEPKVISGIFKKENIISKTGKISETGNGISLENEGVFAYNKKLEGNEVFKGNVKFNMTNTSSQSIGIRMQDAEKAPGENFGYFAEIEKDKVTLKRRSPDGILTLGIVKNKFIPAGETVNIEFGAYPTQNGMRVVLYANANKVFDYTDSYCGNEAGYIIFSNDDGAGIEIFE